MKIFDKFSKVKVLIIGDVMIDRYWWGSVNRISPEAPVPVVMVDNTSLMAGGAANVAVNVAGLGAVPYLIGVVGKDEDAKLFPAILAASKVPADYLIALKNRRTTVKTRIVAHNQHVVRIDQEDAQPLNENDEELVYKNFDSLIDKVDVVVISDYAKGLLTENLLARLIRRAKSKNKKILVDPKGKNYLKYKGATLLTPNQKEAVEAFNLEENGKDLIKRAGKILIENLSLESLLITQGEQGMMLFQKNNKISHLKALARKVYDVTGAGDTVIASLAVAMASGADFSEAAQIANISAGLVVEQIGTTAITLKMLRASL